MGGKQPTTIITDQDLAMKSSIADVFELSIHLYCMWHIMRKIPEKLGPHVNRSEEFQDRLKSCVWISETPEEFEAGWEGLLSDFGLVGNEWLCQIYEISEDWVQVYFSDVHLGCVLRTTSGSESQNSTFRSVTNPILSLVEFWVRFQHVMESQRHRGTQAQDASLTSKPRTKTDLGLELHGQEIYTHANFYIFQQEFWNGIRLRGIESVNLVQEDTMIEINDNSNGKHKKMGVIYNNENHEAECSCSRFTSNGIPCAHILHIWNGKGLKKIPESYILTRWTKHARSNLMVGVDSEHVQASAMHQMQNKAISDAWCRIFNCMQLAGRDLDRLQIVFNTATTLESQLVDMGGETGASDIKNDLEVYYGASVPPSYNFND